MRADALAEAEQVKADGDQGGRGPGRRRQEAGGGDQRTHPAGVRLAQGAAASERPTCSGQRKQAVLSQLASLSALAEQTAQSFPDLDDLGEFGDEQGDRTVLVPAGLLPTLPAEVKEQAAKAKPQDTKPQDTKPTAEPQQPEPQEDPDATIVTSAIQARPLESERVEAGATDESSEPAPEPAAERTEPGPIGDDADLDGDATILVPPDQMPSGIGHLRRRS